MWRPAPRVALLLLVARCCLAASGRHTYALPLEASDELRQAASFIQERPHRPFGRAAAAALAPDAGSGAREPGGEAATGAAGPGGALPHSPWSMEFWLVDGVVPSPMARLDPVVVEKMQVMGIALVPTLLWATSADLGVVAIAACWTLAGVGNMVLTKLAASAFHATGLLVILHMLLGNAMLLLLKRREMSLGRWADLVRWLPVPLLFVAVMWTSLWAYRETTLSTVLILRSALPLVAFPMERLLFGTPQKVTWKMVLALVTVFAGASTYGCWNVSATRHSTCLVLLSCTLMMVDKLLQRHLLTSPDFSMSIPMCMLVTNVIGLFPMLALAWCSGEVQEWRAVVKGASSGAWLLVVVTGVVGICLGLIGLQLQKLVTATMQLVLQNMGKFAALGVGLSAFKDDIHGLSLLGCALALVGSVWYGYLQLADSRKPKKWVWRSSTKPLL